MQEAVHFHNDKLAELNKILDDIERNPTVIDDASFVVQLKAIQAQINELHEAIQNSSGGDETSVIQKLDDIRDRQKEISRTLSEIEENVYSATEKGTMAQESVSSAGDTLKEAEDELNKALGTLQIDGKAALERAKQTAKEYGQQSDKMTNIAQEARHIADKLDDQAKSLVDVAEEAKNKSNQAYELARNTTNQQKNVTMEIRQLRNDVANTENKLEKVKQWTEDVYNRARDAKNNALALLSDINNLIVPNVDIPNLKERADQIKQEAQVLINQTEALINDNDQLLSEIAEQVQQGEDLLSRGVDQQDEVNDLLSDIDLAKAQAENAVELGDKTLKEAQATYETLSRKYTCFHSTHLYFTLLLLTLVCTTFAK